jgi:hypothetical protein
MHLLRDVINEPQLREVERDLRKIRVGYVAIYSEGSTEKVASGGLKVPGLGKGTVVYPGPAPSRPRAEDQSCLRFSCGAHQTCVMSVLPDFSPAQHDDLSPEVDLLGDDPACSDDEDDRALDAHDHSLVTAPILTGDVLGALGTGIFPETALYGRVLSQRGEGLPRKSADGRVFINTNAPFSAVVCGAQVRHLPPSRHAAVLTDDGQGSGKSQTTSVLLESVLIQNGRLGALPEPLSALV